MPMHDWTSVKAGIFHAFHHDWITEISRTLNRELLPNTYYAMPEQIAGKYGPDVVALQANGSDPDPQPGGGGVATAVQLQTRPETQFMAESDGEYYRRKKSSVVIRHVSGDRIVGIVEIVSPGNKSGLTAIQAFVGKACELLEQRLHLLIVDPFPPSRNDPQGIHAAIWEQWSEESFELPSDQPLTAMAYESDVTTRAYIEAFAVGQPLPKMPLFLEVNGCVMVPLEATYQTTFDAMPERWRKVLAGEPG